MMHKYNKIINVEQKPTTIDILGKQHHTHTRHNTIQWTIDRKKKYNNKTDPQ